MQKYSAGRSWTGWLPELNEFTSSEDWLFVFDWKKSGKRGISPLHRPPLPPKIAGPWQNNNNPVRFGANVHNIPREKAWFWFTRPQKTDTSRSTVYNKSSIWRELLGCLNRNLHPPRYCLSKVKITTNCVSTTESILFCIHSPSPCLVKMTKFFTLWNAPKEVILRSFQVWVRVVHPDALVCSNWYDMISSLRTCCFRWHFLQT